MTISSSTEHPDVIDQAFRAWLDLFSRALESQDVEGLLSLFGDECYWKDVLSFTWGYRTFGGREDIGAALRATLPQTKPRNVRPAPDRWAPRLVRRSARDVIEAYFDFDTSAGSGTGFVRLILAGDGVPKAWIVLTTLQALDGFEPQVGEHRPTGLNYSYNFAGDSWADERAKEHEAVKRETDVLIVGAGQAGLALAARLRTIGVQSLLVEKNDRIGDNWRNRYHSLTLHNEVWSNHLPYLPFPESWPAFVPKDKLAGWLEGYAEFMELNVQTGSEVVAAVRDDASGSWAVRVRDVKTGDELTITARHLVLATGGTSGVPNLPALPGLTEFAGEVLHSGAFRSGASYKGKRALVVGTGTSGHDVAQDLASNGAEVTLMQRSATCVVSLIPGGTSVYGVYSEGPPADDVDLVTAAIPFPVLQNTYQWLTRKTNDLDRELLDGLKAKGFRLDFGTDDTGFHMMYLRRGGGYYINVGASDMIISGQIELLQADDYERFTSGGLVLRDGTERSFDLVVLATGYRDQQDGIRSLLGDDVAEKVGPVWGFDDNYVMRNLWQRTPQEALWVVGGSLLDCRLYSRFLSLLIKADLEGIPCPEVPLPSTHYDTSGRVSILEES